MFDRKTEVEAGSVSRNHSGGSAPGVEWSAVRSGRRHDLVGTSPPKRSAIHAGTVCMAARLVAAGCGSGAGGADGGGKESPAGREQAPLSGSCNNPESDWANSHSVSIPRKVETWGPHSWS